MENKSLESKGNNDGKIEEHIRNVTIDPLESLKIEEHATTKNDANTDAEDPEEKGV